MGIEPNNKKENRGKSHQVRFQAVRIYFTVEISIVIRFLGIIIAWNCVKVYSSCLIKLLNTTKNIH